MATDAALLMRYAADGDPDAFRALIERHAGLVYGTALRITGSSHDAEDVAQECFLQLARRAASITSTVAGWLHATATNRAISHLRSSRSRARHERGAAPAVQGEEATWEPMAPHVDLAIQELPEEFRVPLVAHYLEGRTQGDLAGELGISQPTVSRRVADGLEQLRQALRRAGVVAPAAVVAGSLAEHGAPAASSALMAELSKVALTGVGSLGTGVAGAGLAKTVALVAGVALLVVAAGALIHRTDQVPPQAARPAPGAPVGAAPAAGPKAEEPNVSRVKREDGKVWIEGMEDVNWGGSFFTRQDSQVACLVEVLRCAGRDVTYADVMGLSGAAFKVTMAPNLFVPEIHSEMGMDWGEIMQRVFGLRYESNAISFSDEENPDWRDELLAACRQSIDAGLPLFYMDGEWNLIVGYAEDGSAFICKAYYGAETGYQESARPTGAVGDAWFASTFEKAEEPADRRDSVVRSLEAAIELATKPDGNDGDLLFGFAAYEAWLAAVEGDRDDVSLHGNAFSYSQLLTSREAAGEYVRGVADEMAGVVGEELHAAADRYRAIFERMWEGQACVAWPWEENWTAENRAAEAQILRDSLADEREAVAAIERALAAMAGGGEQ